jgi:hypothetical protein
MVECKECGVTARVVSRGWRDKGRNTLGIKLSCGHEYTARAFKGDESLEKAINASRALRNQKLEASLIREREEKKVWRLSLPEYPLRKAAEKPKKWW